MKLQEIADKIEVYLKKFEADPEINISIPESSRSVYYQPNALVGGRYIGIRYIEYQGYTYLKKAEALAYLNWLEAGNVGKHYAVPLDSPK